MCPEEILRKKLQVLYKSKKPVTRKRHVGVEIEFLSEWSESTIKRRLAEADLHPYVQLGTDGSVEDSEYDCSCGYDYDECECRPKGLELRVCAEEREIARVIRKVCKVLKDVDAYVNKTCGLHVHLDMRHRDVNRAYRNLYQVQDWLFKMQPHSRQENDYCKRNEVDSFHAAAERGRYYAINADSYEKYKTLEVRVGAGSIDALKINNWIRLLIATADAKYLGECPKTYSQLRRDLKLSGYLSTFVKQRVEKFNPPAEEPAQAA